MDLKPSAPSVAEKSALSTSGCYKCYDFMGSHPASENGREGWRFRVWAPAAQGVSVIGDFNGWQPESHPMTREPGGLWSLFIPGLAQYDRYQYAVRTAEGALLKKADPYAFHAETRPGTASKLYDLEGYQWGTRVGSATGISGCGTAKPLPSTSTKSISAPGGAPGTVRC